MMRAIGFNRPLPVDNPDCLVDIELPLPKLHPRDVLVEIKAIAVNPADAKIRAIHQPKAGEYRILGWDGAGVVADVGEEVTQFQVGDEVYFSGAINRAGTYAQFTAVDERIVARKPQSIGFAQAAALPLTSLTAWEMLFERLQIKQSSANGAAVLLLVGGAGGVGSVAIQLAKVCSGVQVIATASRPESRAWVQKLGADFVINHHNNMVEELKQLDIAAPSWIFSTWDSAKNLPQMVEMIAPQGRIGVIDDPDTLDVTKLKAKSLSLHWEFMFTRPMFMTDDMAAQGEILAKVADLLDAGKIQTTAQTVFQGINAKNLRKAHQYLECGEAIGKIVLEGW